MQVVKPELLRGWCELIQGAGHWKTCPSVCPTPPALQWQVVARDREVVINSVETADKQFEKCMCSVNIAHSSAASQQIGSNS